MPDVYYDSTLTGQELDEALKKIPLIDAAVEAAQKSAKTAESWAQGGTETRPGENEDNAEYWAGQAKTSASAASTGAQVVTDNQEALDAVKDNIEAIQNAASNAQKAQDSAAAAAEDATKAEAAAKNAQSIAQGQKGYFEDPDALQKAVPEGQDGDWAIVGTTDTIWIWDADTGAWTNSGQNIDLSNYYQKKEVDDALDKKQDKLTGTTGQVVGFDADGAATTVEVGGTQILRNTNTKIQHSSGGWSTGAWTNGLGVVGSWHSIDVTDAPNPDIRFGVHVDNGSGNQYAVACYGIPIIRGQAYTISTYWRSSTGARLVFNYVNSDSIRNYLVKEFRSSGESGWVFSSFTASIDDLGEGNTVEVDFVPLMGASNQADFCGMKLELGSVATDWSPAPEDMQEKPTDGVLVPVYPNAGAHNSIYRGKNIQDKFDDGSLYTAIENGTFDDLYIGDFFDITISTSFTASEKVRCLLAGFDVFWNCGDTALTRHHAVIVPMNCFADSAKMNDANDTTGGYANSKMHTETLPVYATALKAVFGEHFIKNREFMGTIMGANTPSMAGLGYVGATTIAAWQDCELRLMSEVEVYGSTVFSSSAWDVGTAKSRLPLFTLEPNHIVCGLGGANYASTTIRVDWWLSAVASSTFFARAGGDGRAGNYMAGSAFGVRPLWLIG